MADKQEAQKQFWFRLEQALRERDVLASELATKLKTSRATVSEWKVRGSWPTGYVLIQLSKVLRVNIHWLLTGEGTMDAGRDERPGDEALVQRGVNLALAQVEMAVEDIRARSLRQRRDVPADPLMPPDAALALAAAAPPIAPARRPPAAATPRRR